jgi:inositol-phosphate phosphatase/L-galactose 1-phosphate phosphatase/histidinol-phosphatase
MSQSSHAEFVAFAESLADASREILLAVAAQVPEVGIKPDASLVTATDKAVEARLREMIEVRYPAHGVMGEELGQRDADAEFVWVLDPIDGTAPFVAGLPVYGTLIGLARDGRPLLGVIDHPATDDRWLGVVGEGTTRNGTPQHIRACESLETAFATNSSPDFMTAEERERLERVRARVRYMQYGGSCFAYGLLASGRTDIALDGGFDIHDILAVAAVIEAAGGIVTDWDGNAIDLSWRGRVVAAGDPRRHREVLALLAEGA